MKNIFSYISEALPKKLLLAFFIAVAAIMPISMASAEAVRIEGSLGVANVTAGDTLYAQSVNATYDQVVKFQVYYHNTENPDSGKIAENLRVKINIPTTAGTTRNVTSTISADNSNTINSQVSVNTDRADSYLEFIPGSAVWKHNTGTNEAPVIVEQKISDAVVTDGQGLVLENTKPCFNFDATVTVLARVRVPAVKIVKESRVKGSGAAYSNTNTAKPGETLEYRITYQNIGNTQQNNVVIRDNLPPFMTYVAGSTQLANQTNPSYIAYNSDNITTGGIVIGNYGPNANAYVKFEAKIADEKSLACGNNEFRNVGVARPEGMNEYYNTAITNVTRKCVTPEGPNYSCDAVNVTKIQGRQIKASVVTTALPANRVQVKSYEFNFGDGTTPLVTTDATREYTYSKDGTFNIAVKVTFMVDGKEKVVSGSPCVASVTFGSTTPPTEIPNTGAGSVFGLLAATTVAGAIAHRIWTVRKS